MVEYSSVKNIPPISCCIIAVYNSCLLNYLKHHKHNTRHYNCSLTLNDHLHVQQHIDLYLKWPSSLFKLYVHCIPINTIVIKMDPMEPILWTRVYLPVDVLWWRSIQHFPVYHLQVHMDRRRLRILGCFTWCVEIVQYPGM